MRIGELAKATGVNIQTIRFYEREGLLRKPLRLPSGYREYAPTDVAHITFIRSCQGIGFTLRDVKEVLDLHGVLASPEQTENLKPKAQKELLMAARRRLASIDEKLKLLVAMKRGMTALVTTLGSRQKPTCPVSGMTVT